MPEPAQPPGGTRHWTRPRQQWTDHTPKDDLDLRAGQRSSAFVSVSDLIEQLEAAGTEHSIQIFGDGRHLVLYDPHTLRRVGVIEFTPGGAYFRKGD